LTEDEAEEDVETADGEEEEGRDEGEVVDVVGEDGSADSELGVSRSMDLRWRWTYKH
jgi:hypothetical protein